MKRLLVLIIWLPCHAMDIYAPEQIAQQADAIAGSLQRNLIDLNDFIASTNVSKQGSRDFIDQFVLNVSQEQEQLKTMVGLEIGRREHRQSTHNLELAHFTNVPHDEFDATELVTCLINERNYTQVAENGLISNLKSIYINANAAIPKTTISELLRSVTRLHQDAQLVALWLRAQEDQVPPLKTPPSSPSKSPMSPIKKLSPRHRRPSAGLIKLARNFDSTL